MHVDIPRMLDVPATDFRREFCVSRDTFYDIVSLVRMDPVYAVQPRGRPQASVEFQVAVALWRVTHNGDGCSVVTVARTFGCAGEFPQYPPVLVSCRMYHAELSRGISVSLYGSVL